MSGFLAYGIKTPAGPLAKRPAGGDQCYYIKARCVEPAGQGRYFGMDITVRAQTAVCVIEKALVEGPVVLFFFAEARQGLVRQGRRLIRHIEYKKEHSIHAEEDIHTQLPAHY